MIRVRLGRRAFFSLTGCGLRSLQRQSFQPPSQLWMRKSENQAVIKVRVRWFINIGAWQQETSGRVQCDSGFAEKYFLSPILQNYIYWFHIFSWNWALTTFLGKMRRNTKMECRFEETDELLLSWEKIWSNFSWDSTTTSVAGPNGKTQAFEPRAKSAVRFLPMAKWNWYFPGHLFQDGLSRNCTELLQEKKEEKEMKEKKEMEVS